MRCKSCKFWIKVLKDDTTGRHWGDCKEIQENELIEIDNVPGIDGVIAGTLMVDVNPNFGCILWEPREVR